MKPEYCEKCHGYFEPEGIILGYGNQLRDNPRCKHREICALAYNMATIVAEEKIRKENR